MEKESRRSQKSTTEKAEEQEPSAKKSRSMMQEELVADADILNVVHKLPTPDDMVLRRSAFDFLKERNAVPENACFTSEEEHADVRTNVEIGFPGRGKPATAIYFHRFVAGVVFLNESYIVRTCTYQPGSKRVSSKLNVSERMNMTAFPLSVLPQRMEIAGSSSTGVTTRAHGDLRYFDALPDECLLRVLSFAASMQDLFLLMTICQRWHCLIHDDVAADTSFWKPLCLRYYPVLGEVYETISGSVTWKKLFLDRARHLKAVFQPKNDPLSERDVYDGIMDGPFQPRDLGNYEKCVTVILWNEGAGFEQLSMLSPELGQDGGISVELPKDAFQALTKAASVEIVIQHPHMDAPTARTLYAGTVDDHNEGLVFTPYNQYEKFRGRSFMVGLRNMDDMTPMSIPCIKPDICREKQLTLKMHPSWQVSNQGDCVPMSEEDALVFLEKGLSYRDRNTSSVTCLDTSRPTPTTSTNYSTSRFEPRSLDSYGLLVDFFLDTNEAYPCLLDVTSRFLESPTLDNRLFIEIPIPPKLSEMIPSPNNVFTHENYIAAVVHLIDKAIGAQARLYQGTVCGFDVDFDTGESFLMMSGSDIEYAGTDTFDVSSFFSQRDDPSNNHGPVPEVHGELYDGPLLRISFFWKFSRRDHSAQGVSLNKDEILTYLDKGLAWGSFPS